MVGEPLLAPLATDPSLTSVVSEVCKPIAQLLSRDICRSENGKAIRALKQFCAANETRMED